MDDSELREYSHLFLSNVAAAMKEGFAPYLQPAMQRVMQSLMQDDGADNSADDQPDKVPPGSGLLHATYGSLDGCHLQSFCWVKS